MSPTLRAPLISLFVVATGLGLSLAAGSAGTRLGALPLVTWVVIAAFVIQWVAFVSSLLRRTDRHFDLTGSLTYILLTTTVLVLAPVRDARALLVTCLVVVWAARLGTFLFRRVSRSGGDSRFTEILAAPPRLFVVWTLQGLWVSLTALAAWTAITSSPRPPLGWWDLLAVVVWLAGFALEVVADRQKSAFRADPANRGEFIRTGLWARSRHPNYAGEILLWVGVFLLAVPTLQGWQWVVAVSPLFVVLLLTKVSGLPQLEFKAEKTWGERADYRHYRDTTPVLVPRLTRPPRR